MNKVYVVTAGEYSAYHIVGVFTDKALAQKYVDRYNAGSAWSSADIEEFEPDTIINREYLYKSFIFIDFSGKAVQDTEYIERESYHKEFQFESGMHKGLFNQTTAVGYADTPEKAQKIAQDLWAQAKAEEAGL